MIPSLRSPVVAISGILALASLVSTSRAALITWGTASKFTHTDETHFLNSFDASRNGVVTAAGPVSLEGAYDYGDPNASASTINGMTFTKLLGNTDFWGDSNWARHALELGNRVVMAPASHTYFDCYQEPQEQALAKGVEYEAIAGFLPIETVYSFDPAFVAADDRQKKLILGTQAQLWSEYFKTWNKVEYMAYPRLAALAEVAWSPLERKDYDDFLARLEPMLARYRAAGIKHGPVFSPPKRETRDGAEVTTSLGTYSDHWPELAYDGRDDTF